MTTQTSANISERPRARKIVVLAAEGVEDPQAQSWLRSDERGTWESAALDFLVRTRDRATELGMSDGAVDAEIATMLRLMALETRLRGARKSSSRRGTSSTRCGRSRR